MQTRRMMDTSTLERALNELFLPKLKLIKDNEALLYVNYYGLMNKNVEMLSKIYRNVIIVNSQAFYTMPKKDIPTSSRSADR